ncbi:MAG: DnaA/Hda family protein [Burkholderiaceae bacterium]
MQQLPLDLIQAPAPSLDNFVVGPNAEALDVITLIASGQAPARIVFLSGPAGSGKTHLLQALASLPDCGQFDQSPPAPAEPLKTLWVADNISSLPENRLQDLFNLINALRSEPNSCLVAADMQRAAQLTIREDLRTRLASGLVIGLELLSDEQKAHALGQYAQARGLNAADNVLTWLLTHQDRDIRHLMAYLDAVDRYALQNRRQLTLPLLREFERKHRSDPAADKIETQS